MLTNTFCKSGILSMMENCCSVPSPDTKCSLIIYYISINMWVCFSGIFIVFHWFLSLILYLLFPTKGRNEVCYFFTKSQYIRIYLHCCFSCKNQLICLLCTSLYPLTQNMEFPGNLSHLFLHSSSMGILVSCLISFSSSSPLKIPLLVF